MTQLSLHDLKHLKLMIDSVQAEQELLSRDYDWYVSDCVDLVESAREIVYGALGITIQEEEDYDE